MTREKKFQSLKPEDIRRIRFVSDPMVHPNSDRIAYVVRMVDKNRKENRYQAEIRLTDSTGRQHKELTTQELDMAFPLWSPDGRYLLFLSKRAGDEKKQIYLLPADGGEARRLTKVEGGVTSAEWSPDGKHIVFRSLIDPRGRSGSKKEDDKTYSSDVQVLDQALWQLNGLGSRVNKRAHIFVVSRRGGKPVQLTDGAWSVGGPFHSQVSHTFSIDGKSIYYLATPDPDDDWAIARRVDIYVVNLDGTGRRRITEFPGVFTAVRQSPSGELIAIGNDLALGWASPSRLWRVDSESGRYQAVLPDLDLSLGDGMNCDVRFPTRDHDPWISPDGSRVRARITQRSAVRLAEVDLETSSLSWLTPDDLSVLGWHSTSDGAMRVEIRSTMTTIPELWAIDEKGVERRITRLNDRLLARRKVFAIRQVDFISSDGERIEAWVHIPRTNRTGDKPVILAIHGGPKTVYGHAFYLEFQILAGAGMAVAFSNPRGSDGYGEEWAYAVHGHYGERDYQDLMEFVDHILSLDLGLDSDRLGVWGGSYGGFMTNWIIGHTDRFKAAVSQRGISNWVSFFGTSDIGYFFNPDHVGGLPWSDPDLYREKSPLTYVESIHTPLLLIHSENDLRCPIEQAEQLFTYLKRMGRTVRLARFPDETHELSRSGKPNRRMERLRLILQWFQERL
jgi:dipeptidyl aminopeptidase/acylaminoacyl peptidase